MPSWRATLLVPSGDTFEACRLTVERASDGKHATVQRPVGISDTHEFGMEHAPGDDPGPHVRGYLMTAGYFITFYGYLDISVT